MFAADALAALALATTMSHRCATPFSSRTFLAVSGDLHSCYSKTMQRVGERGGGGSVRYRVREGGRGCWVCA